MRQLKISKTITSREEASLAKYLQEIGKIELLTPQQEAEFATQIQQGNQRAKDQLVRANLRFVVSVAKQYQGNGLSLADLVNEGNIGLLKAAEKFDVTRGFKFISFAVWWIRQNILQAISEHSRMIRIPMNKMTARKQVQYKMQELEQKLNRQPSADELADALEMTADEVRDLLKLNDHHTSLDAPMSQEDDGSLLDTLENENANSSDDKVEYTESLNRELHRSMQVLNERQQLTLRYYFGIGVDNPLSIDDISRKFDLTPERVRQIKEKALIKLRGTRNVKQLAAFF